MQRSVALVLGVTGILLGGLALGPGDVRAGEGEKGKTPEEKVEKKVERKAIVFRGHGARGFLGVGLEDVEGREARGAAVRSVEEKSPAEEAGIREGDVIVRFDGESVRSAAQLARLVGETPPGRSVPVEVTRDGSSQTLTLTLDERSARWVLGEDHDVLVPDREFDITVPEPFLPHTPGAPFVRPGPQVFRWRGPGDSDFATPWNVSRPTRLGIRYMEIGDQLAEYFGLEKDEGVLVSSVDEDSPAARAGLKAGDVILEFDGKAIDRGRDLREQVAEAEGGEEITLRVMRHEKALDLKLTLPEPMAPRHRRTGVSL